MRSCNSSAPVNFCDQFNYMKIELETNFSDMIMNMRQNIMSEFRGAIQGMANLFPQNASQPLSSTRAGFIQNPPFGHGISAQSVSIAMLLPNLPHPLPMLNATFLALSPPSWPPPQFPQEFPVTPALSSLLSVFGHQVPPWQFPVAPTAPVPSVSVNIQQLQQSTVGGLGAKQMQPSAPVIPPILAQPVSPLNSVPAAVNMSKSADPEFATLENKTEENMTVNEKIHVPDFCGDSSRFKHWVTQLYHYVFGSGLHEVSNEAMLRALDQHILMGTPPQKVLESSRFHRKQNDMAPLTVAQEMMLLQQHYQSTEDPTHLMTLANNLEWNGKVASLPELVADVESAYVKSNPKADCTKLSVLSIVTKIGAQNIHLADELIMMLANDTLMYSYAV